MKAEPAAAPGPEPEPQQPPERQQAQRSQRQAPPLVWRETEEISSTESTPTSSPPAPQSARPPDARVQLVWKETEEISDGDDEEEDLSDEEEDDSSDDSDVSDSKGSWSPEAQRRDVQARAAREIDRVVGAELTRAAHCAAAAEGVRDMARQLQGQQGREVELAPAANHRSGAVWGAEAASAIADLAGSPAGNER